MANTEFPPKDSPDLHLVVATPEENLAQTNANSIEWRGALSLEAYLRREELLLNQDLTRDGGLTAWMLVYQPPNGSERQVLCGCESIKKKALLAKDGKVEDVVAHGVASVFCPPKYRGKGYAGRMMSEVGKRLKGWQAEGSAGSAFSVLYSDIGKAFYKARGWEPFPSAHISLPATSSPGMDLGSGSVGKLEGSDLAELCAIDEQILRSRLERDTSGDSMVALLPDVATLTWHHARENFVATELNGGQRPEFMQHGRGAIVQVKPDSRVWCYWTRVWTNPQEEAPNTLHILRIVIEDAYPDFTPATKSGVEKVRDSPIVKAIAKLLGAAQVEAERSGMKEVQIWNPTSTTLAAAQLLDAKQAVVEREEESIASLLWYGEGDGKGNVEWVCNEKYGWC